MNGTPYHPILDSPLPHAGAYTYRMGKLGIDPNPRFATATCRSIYIPDGKAWDRSMGLLVAVTRPVTCDGHTYNWRMTFL
jgi:hypothetical protein